MTVYSVNTRTQSFYGQSIGILILNAAYPCIPGNVGNATTFSFPVRYKVIEEASIDRLLNKQDPTLLKPFINAAKELESEGVKAITGACGFMALFQQEIKNAVKIPVFLSSLLQINFILQILEKDKKIGVITADAKALSDRHFSAAGVPLDAPIVIAGMENQPEFRDAVLKEKGTLDSDRVEKEVVSVARALVDAHPDIGAMVLECSDLPPYAQAVQASVNLPVFDFVTMINFVHASVNPTGFAGHM